MLAPRTQKSSIGPVDGSLSGNHHCQAMSIQHQNPDAALDRGTGPSDLALVQRALAGDRAAVDLVMQRFACVPRFVYRLNLRLGYQMPAESLEDVVQQVYLAIWPRLADFAGSAALETWVFGFCRNCLRSEYRRRGSSLRLAGADEELSERDDEAPAPLARAEQVESVDLLHEELDRLDAEDREIVEMRHLQDRSFEAIARQKGLPPSTVKDRCYKALDKIRTRLKNRHGRI